MTLYNSESKRRLFTLYVIGISLLVFSFYFSTLAPGVLGGDAGELQFVPSRLGLPHPSGYPLQVLTDKLWVSVVPWGSVAWKTNLLSSVVATVGTLLLFLYTYEYTNSLLLSTSSMLLLASSEVYWGQAILSDKYALTGLLSSGILLAAFRFWENRTFKALVYLSFVAGLALSHHRSMAVLLPAILLLLLYGKCCRQNSREFLTATLAFLAPLSLYSYLLFSNKEVPPRFVSSFTPEKFLNYVLVEGAVGQVRLLPNASGLQYYWKVFFYNFPAFIAILGITGLLLHWLQNRDKRPWMLFLTIGFVFAAYLAANYENFDFSRRYVYFIPSYVFVSAILVTGIFKWHHMIQNSKRLKTAWPVYVFDLLILALIMYRIPHVWRVEWKKQKVSATLGIWRQDLKSGQKGDRIAKALSLVKEQDVLVVGDWEQATPLWYSQVIDGRCPKCIIRQNLDLLDAYKKEFPEKTLYVARTLPNADTWSYPTSVGPLVRLDKLPSFSFKPNSSYFQPLRIIFDDKVELMGINWPFGAPECRAGHIIPFELVWKRAANAAHVAPFSVSLRFSSSKKVVFQEDSSAPVLGMYPFSKLRPGQVISDYHEVSVPINIQPEEYHLTLILYRNINGSFLNAEAISENGVALGSAPVILSLKCKPGNSTSFYLYKMLGRVGF